MNINDVLSALDGKGTRFVSLVYRSEGTKELARHTILLGVDTVKAYERDLARLLLLQPHLEGIKRIACDELINSLKNSLSKGLGQNDSYTCKDKYEETSIKGVKAHKETGVLHLMGYSIAKVTLEEGESKEVKSNDKTIEKNKLRKLGRLGKIRQFKLQVSNIQEVRANGKIVEII